MTTDHRLTLQVAYQISEDFTGRTNAELFWALDRFDWDRHTLIGDAAEQRSEATQRIAIELDRRNVPVRNPALPSTYITDDKPEPMKPNSAFQIIRPDEVAECWDGVGDDLYRALWACVNDYKAPSPEVSEEPCYGLDCVADFWDRFTDAQKAALNALADERGDY